MKDKKLTIEIQSILKDLLKNLWVIVLVAIISNMCVYIANHRIYKPEYTSTATLVVTSKGSSSTTYTNYSVSADIASIFTNVFADPIIKTKAEEYLGRSFNGSVSGSVSDGTNFIYLNVTSDSPQNSYELLNAVLKVYPQVSEYVFDNATVMLIKAPSLPNTPSNKLSSDNVALIRSGCIILAVFIIIVLSVMRDTIKNEEDFKNKIGGKLLGILRHETKKATFWDTFSGKKRKRSLRIHANPYVSFSYVENMHKIAAKIEYLNKRHSDKVFMVTSVAENAGKSTVASNIALSLAERGKSVLLVDFDFKKPAIYKIFEINNSKEYELSSFFNDVNAEKNFTLAQYKDTSVSLKLNTKPQKDGSSWIERGAVQKFIEFAKTKVDFVIIDTAPFAADSSITELAKYADKLIMVVKTDLVKADTINKTVSTLEAAGAKIGGFVLNDAYHEFAPASFSGADETGNYRYAGYHKYGKYANYSRHKKYSKK